MEIKKLRFLRGLAALTAFVVTAFVGLKSSPSLANQVTPLNAVPLKGDPTPIRPPQGFVPKGILKLGEGEYFSPYVFFLDKSSRTLSVWKKEYGQVDLVGIYASDMGSGNGDKKKLGDYKTPEGIYFFQRLYEGKNLNFDLYGVRAFTMNYPNYFDQRENKTGSGIWLHAIPDYKPLSRGSRGCIVVRNKIIKELSDYITLKKTPIIVEDKVQYISQVEYQLGHKKWRKWITSWADHWQSKDLDKYISYYSKDFRGKNLTKKQWKNYKKRLNNQYDTIRVDISEPVIYLAGNEGVIRFLQNYQSDKITDFGEKTLYLKKNDDGEFKIYHETWERLSSNLLAEMRPLDEQTKTMKFE